MMPTTMEKSSDAKNMSPKPSDLELGEVITRDAVFGEITNEGPNYRNVRNKSHSFVLKMIRL